MHVFVTGATVGDGSNRWPAIHRDDAAVLFRLALEQAPAGSVLHGVGEEGIALMHIAQTIGTALDLPVSVIEPDQAQEHFGWLAPAVGADVPASSERTRELLGWEPTHPGSARRPRAAVVERVGRQRAPLG